MNIYETTTMLEAIRLRPPYFTFLHDTFFKQTQFMYTEKAQIDIVKGGVKASVLVAPRVNGILETRHGYRTKEITTPRFAPKRVLSGEDLMARQPGDTIYTRRGPQEIASRILMQDLEEMRQENALALEWLCSKVLQGKNLLLDEYDERGNKAGEFEVNFNFTNYLTAKTKWTSEKANPLQDIEDWIDEYITGKTSLTPTRIVLDPEAGKAFKNNPHVKEWLHENALAGRILANQYKGTGVTSFGNFTKYNVEVLSYSNIIRFGEEVGTQLLDKGSATILPNDPGVVVYGAITQMENGNWVKFMEKEVPKYVRDDIDEIVTLRLATRPLPFIRDLDCYVHVDGLV